jgi:hypothetical protein
MSRALVMVFPLDGWYGDEEIEGMSDDDILNEAYAYCYLGGAMIPQADIYFEE